MLAQDSAFSAPYRKVHFGVTTNPFVPIGVASSTEVFLPSSNKEAKFGGETGPAPKTYSYVGSGFGNVANLGLKILGSTFFACGSTSELLPIGPDFAFNGTKAYVSQVDTSYNYKSAFYIGSGNANVIAYKLALSGGFVYVVGVTSENLTTGAVYPGTKSFIGQYLPDGTRQWVTELGSGNYSTQTSNFNNYTTGNGRVIIDTSGNSYYTGFTSEVLPVPGGGPAGITGISQGFVVSYSPTGTQNWLTNVGSGFNSTYCSTVDFLNPSGTPYLLVAGTANEDVTDPSHTALIGNWGFFQIYQLNGTLLQTMAIGSGLNSTLLNGLKVLPDGLSVALYGSTNEPLDDQPGFPGAAFSGTNAFVTQYTFGSGTYSSVQIGYAVQGNTTTGFGIEVDDSLNAYVVGVTDVNLNTGMNLPGQGTWGFCSKVNLPTKNVTNFQTGSGTQYVFVDALTIDPSDSKVYIGGFTSETLPNGPVLPGGGLDAFITRAF